MTSALTTMTDSNVSRRRFLALASAAAALPVVAATLGVRPAFAAAGLRAPWTRHGIAADASAEFRAVAETVSKVMEAAKIPGVALGVYANGRSETAYLGTADIANQTPVTPSTRFQMGSVAKTYVATAAMRLIEEGRMELHAPVRAYLPGLRLADEDTARRVTIWHLMNHTSGIWGDYGGEVGNGDDASERYVAEVLPTLPVIFPLGEHVSYSNAAVGLLGRVIEVVTGQTFRQAMQRLVFDPLKLSASAYDDASVRAGPYARGYGTYPDGRLDEVTPLFLDRIVDAPGGLWTTMDDLLSYGRFQLGIGPAAESGAVISRKTQLAMQRGEVEVTGMKGLKEARVGQAWFNTYSGGLIAVEHQGSTAAHQAGLRLVPSREFAIGVLTNAQSGGAAFESATETAYEQYFGITASVTDLDFTAMELTPKQLADYAGVYGVPTEEIDLRMENGRLHAYQRTIRLRGDWHVSNEPADADIDVQFVGEDFAVQGTPEAPEGMMRFVRRPDGRVGWLAQGVRMLPRLR